MGVYLSTPKTDKTSDDGENEKLRYGVSSMQRWRTSMEDVMLLYLTWTTPHLSLAFMMAMEGRQSLSSVPSIFTGQLLKQEAYAACDIGTAAQKSFHRMDEMMCGKRGWRELAILGNKMDQFSGMIEGLICGLLSSFNLLGHTTPIQAGSLLLVGPFLDYWLTEKRVNMFKYDISSMDFLVLLIEDKELVENPMIDAWLLKNRKSPWVGKKEGLQGCWIFY
ncbi:unnamed protein product [Lactuca saligna]|uniref:Uncharacterized protein n=1 Tax=Lactuca saligna TaxID=75948 RepID=A0AA35YQ29_LACSI|nr:unnamed protein product [Lactuca saligna]